MRQWLKHHVPRVAFLAALLAVGLLLPAELCAGPVPVEIPEGTCTSQPQYDIPTVGPGEGLISTIVQRIKTPLSGLAQSMFEAIAGDGGFQNVVRLASSLYIAIYGILFMFGMVQVTIHDLMIRLIKLGIMNMLISPSAWTYFSLVVVRFFNDGVDSIICEVTSLGLAGIAPDVTCDPTSEFPYVSAFLPLDQALVYVVSAKMVITVLATFTTGPYGFVIGLILLMSLGSFLKAIFNALWVYIMGLVIRTLMFGIAPIFLVCVMFSRTRHLFDGWLNQVVNASLQPVFLFTFFTFFVILLRSCMEQVLQNPVCWIPTQHQVGTPNVAHFWRFAIKDCGVTGEPWVPFDGIWDFDGAKQIDRSCNPKVHPIGIIVPLMLWILADLAGRFNNIVVEIARDLSNAATDLTMGADSIKSWFNKATEIKGAANNEGSPGGAPGKRTGPDTLKGLEEIVKKASEPKKPGADTKPGEIPPTRPVPGGK